MKIIAVVPAYNESLTIRDVIKSLKAKVNDVIVVDDGSKDKTFDFAKEEGAVVLQHFLNRGQGASLKTGIDFAVMQGADIIITFDADGQHDADDINVLIKPIIEGGADVVLGSRFFENRNLKSEIQKIDKKVSSFKFQVSNMPLLRFLILKLALLFTRLTTSLKVTDTHNGLRALSREAAQKISISQNGMAHASEILEEISKNILRYIEVPCTIRYTEYSKKKGQSAFGAFKILWDLLLGKLNK